MNDDTPPCRIEQQLGRLRPCPREGCAFWDPSGTVKPNGCVFDGVDFAGREELARWLHDLRTRLETTT